MAPEMRVAATEWEPKTLTLEQLKYAREAALYVLSTKTAEEAIRIFTEGMKPVLNKKKDLMDYDEEETDTFDSDACNNNHSSGNSNHCPQTMKRDIVTAPF